MVFTGELDNDDEYADDSPGDWHYDDVGLRRDSSFRKAAGEGETVRYPYPLKYNWVTHLWECGCSTYAYKGSCRHAIRLRKEELVDVNEEYL